MPAQYTDERTGASLFVAAEPMVFARERTDIAAHARDFVTLVAIATDEVGVYREYVLLYRWSTVDTRMLAKPDAAAGSLRISADGRVLDLQPIEPLPADLQPRPELLPPEHADTVVHAYAVDWATLRYLSMSRELTVRLPQERLDLPYTLRNDGRAAWGQFVQLHPGQ